MTWTLSSGRELEDPPYDLSLDRSGRLRQGYDGEASMNPAQAPWSDDPKPLTVEERREIAEAVKAAWNRWAETEKP